MTEVTADLRAAATDAATLLRYGLSPRLRPNRDGEYNALVVRYTTDSAFRSLLGAIASGQGLEVLACDRMEGLVLSPIADSPYRMRLADYVQVGSTDIRLLHGLVQLAIAATAYPTAAALDDGSRLVSVSAMQVYERLRSAIDEHYAADAEEVVDADPTTEAVWRAIRRLRQADTTSDGRDTPHNVLGAIRKALRWLEDQGLSDVVAGEQDTWRLRDRYRLQVLGAANEAADLLRDSAAAS